MRALSLLISLSSLIIMTARAAAAPPNVPCKQLNICLDRCAKGEKDICRFVEGIQGLSKQEEAACERGEIPKCVEMANVYEFDSFFVGQTPPGTVTHLRERACDGGDADSCTHLGAAFAAGKRVAKDDARALALWKKGCELKSGHACMSIGNRYREGRGVARDTRLADTYLEQSCTLGSADGCFYMGILVNDLGTPSRVRVRNYYERGCKLGSPWACMAGRNLGSAVSNPAAETKMFETEGRLCEDGYPASCNNVGLAYARGVGVTRDLPRAAEFRARACDIDHGPACRDLAEATLAGAGVQRSPADARALYDKACRLEDYVSCETLGGLLIDGRKLPGDPPRGIELCARACEHGLAASCRRLADAYGAGRAVERDADAAKRHRERACALGDRASCGKSKR